MNVPLTASSFFKYFIIHPWSKELSKKDRTKATISTIAFGALLGGVPHLVARFKKFKSPYIKPSHLQNSDFKMPKEDASSVFKRTLSNFSVRSNLLSSSSKMAIPRDKENQENLLEFELLSSKNEEQKELLEPVELVPKEDHVEQDDESSLLAPRAPKDKSQQEDIPDLAPRAPKDKSKQEDIPDLAPRAPKDKSKQEDIPDLAPRAPKDKSKQEYVADQPHSLPKKGIPKSISSSLELSGDWIMLGEAPKNILKAISNAKFEMTEKLKGAKTCVDLSFESGCKMSREVLQIETKAKDVFYAKLLPSRYNAAQKKGMKNDALAFLVDQVFNFGVVPTTLLVTKDSEIDHSFIAANVMKMKYPFIIQAGVSTVDWQKEKCKLQQIQNAILFNFIIGREDATENNTVVDLNHKIFEIDNEQIGVEKTDSWLIKSYTETIFDPKIIEAVVNTPLSQLELAFELFEIEYKKPINPLIKSNIINNYHKLCDFCNKQGINNISVDDLNRLYL